MVGTFLVPPLAVGLASAKVGKVGTGAKVGKVGRGKKVGKVGRAGKVGTR